MALARREFAPRTTLAHLATPFAALPAFARLAVLCVGLVALETLALLRVGAGSALALAPQVAAPAPWGVFHDERWLLAYAGSWPTLVGGAILLVAAQGVLTDAMVKATWPRTADPLSWRKALTRGISSTAVAALLLSPCASLLVAFSLAPISDLWLAAIPAALGIAIFVHHGPVDCWWLRHPRLRSMGWVLLSYAELTVAGSVLVSAPRGWASAVAVAAGLANAWAWRGYVHALARPARLRLAPVSPLGLAGVVVLVLPLAVLFAAFALTISLFARTQKEAQTYLAPLVAVVILPAVSGMLPGVELDTTLALVPVLNVVLACKALVSGVWPWTQLVLIFGSTCVYAGLALTACVRMFGRERVLFRT